MAEILWIEEQPEQRANERIKYITKKHPDYSFTVAINDAEGTRKLREKRFDLVIFDIRMEPAEGDSVVDPITPSYQVGLRLLQALREGKIGGETPKDVPVIIVSAIIDQDDKKVIMDVIPSPEAYLEKPADLFEFVEAVERSLKENVGV